RALAGAVDQEEPDALGAGLTAVPHPVGEREAVAARHPHRLAAVGELVGDLAVEAVARVTLGAPLLPEHARLVLHERPADAVDLRGAGRDAWRLGLERVRAEVDDLTTGMVAHAGQAIP